MGHIRISIIALIVLVSSHAYGFPFQQQPQSNDNGLLQALMEIVTKPFVGIIDVIANLLKFLREKLRPNDKQGQAVLQQAQDMFNQALDNALIKELQKLKPDGVIDKIKEGADGLQNSLSQAISS